MEVICSIIISFHHLPHVSREPSEFLSYSSGFVKAQALQRETRQGAREISHEGSWTRLLQPTVPCSEGVRRVETGYLSLETHRLCHPYQSKMETVFCLGSHQKEGHNFLQRSQGHLPTDSYPLRLSTIPSHSLECKGLSVLGFLFWAFHNSPGPHQSILSGVRVGLQERGSAILLSERLACHSRICLLPA